MADANIGSLPPAASLDDGALLVAEIQGVAVKVTGAQLKALVRAGVEVYVSSAQQAATEAQDAAQMAQAAADGVGAAVASTQANAQAAATAREGAEDARTAIENMLVEAIALETGKPATVSKELVDGVVKLVFGLPRGAKGDRGDAFAYEDFTEEQLAALKGPKGDAFSYDDFTAEQLEALRGPAGASIQSIARTSGTGAAGTTDTYTVTLTDGSTTEFYVYNGKDGTGAGDMTASVYDPQGKRQDIFAYVDAKYESLLLQVQELLENVFIVQPETAESEGE